MPNAAPNRAQRRANGNKPDVPADVLVIDLNDIRVREIEEIEELTGESFDAWASAFTDPSKPRGKALRLFAYIIKKRDNPEFTMEEAGDLRIVFDDANPTKAAGRKS